MSLAIDILSSGTPLPWTDFETGVTTTFIGAEFKTLFSFNLYLIPAFKLLLARAVYRETTRSSDRPLLLAIQNYLY